MSTKLTPYMNEVINYALSHSVEEACQAYGVTQETFNRYKRYYKGVNGAGIEDILALKSQFSPSEIKAITKSRVITPITEASYSAVTPTNTYKFGFITDTHFGSKYTSEAHFREAISAFKQANCDAVAHCGDVTEGMTNRPGHFYDLEESLVGYKNQRRYSADMLKLWEGKWYIISGNHDLWYTINSNCGANVVEDICGMLPNAEFLGDEVGTFYINGKIKVDLFHGRDGASYATSYRAQKIIETYPQKELPQILLTGHDHKRLHIIERDARIVGGGSVQSQTPFMRLKKIAANPGYNIITVKFNDAGVIKSFTPEFFEFDAE